jgi:hypothetical protein
LLLKAQSLLHMSLSEPMSQMWAFPSGLHIWACIHGIQTRFKITVALTTCMSRGCTPQDSYGRPEDDFVEPVLCIHFFFMVSRSLRDHLSPLSHLTDTYTHTCTSMYVLRVGLPTEPGLARNYPQLHDSPVSVSQMLELHYMHSVHTQLNNN